MPCILTAHTTGSLEAVTLNLLQSDIKQLYIDPDYHWYQNLEAEASGSLEASKHIFLNASVSQSLQASFKPKLNAKYCVRFVAL